MTTSYFLLEHIFNDTKKLGALQDFVQSNSLYVLAIGFNDLSLPLTGLTLTYECIERELDTASETGPHSFQGELVSGAGSQNGLTLEH